MNLKDLNNLRADTEGRIKAVFLICMFVLVSAGGFAQNTKSISGTVREKGSNETVIGATVQVKGAHNGVITNENGEYTIKNVSPGQVLVFSMIGMNTVEKTVGSQNRIDVLMDSGVLIDEVVVTGYQTQRKVDLTGSVSSLSSDQFMQTNPLSLEQALKGKISGVQVMNNDGAPGGGITIKIRGASSITAGSSPLYVIDGFPLPISDDPLESPLATISPDAIESISILKDVSSTAIYGAQGANGVVLITTKKGAAGMSEISVKATYGISKLANSIPMLGAEDYMRAYMRDMIMSGRWQNADFYQEYKDQVWNTNPSRFQFYPDLCLQNGTKQNYEVSYRGGTERIQNSTIFSLMNEDGIAINTGFKRFYFQTNNSIKLLPQLTLNTNISYEHNIRSGAFWTEGNIFNEIQTFSPLVPKEWTFQEIDDNLYYTGKMDNPYRKLKDIDYNNKNNTFFGQAELVYNINDNWFVKGGIGIRIPKGEVKEFVPKTIQRGYDNNGLATYATQSGLNMRGVIQAGFNKVFNKVHSLSVNAVYEANTNKYETFNQEYSQFNTDLGWEGIYDAKSGNHVKSPGVSYEKIAMLSGVFMANYSYKGRYLLKASMRADGSSKFSPDNRWGFFPSGALGWRVSEEKFWAPLKSVVSNLKFRASWGQLGNQNVGDYYPFASLVNIEGINYIFNNKGVSGAAITNMANKDITWETTTVTDFGIDATLWNKLNVSFDYYYKKTKDILLQLDVPLIIGLNAPMQNAGVVENRGWDLSLSYNDKIGDFTYRATFNISDVRNKILDMKGVNQTGLLVNREGEEMNSIYGFKTIGYIQPEDYDANGNYKYAKQFGNFGSGDIRYEDVKQDGSITSEDRQILGGTIPRYTYGLSLYGAYKGFDLSMLFQGVGKANGYIEGHGIQPFFEGGTVQEQHKDYWTNENRNAKFPRLAFNETNNIQYSSFWMKNAAYCRLKNLQVGYTLPKKWTEKCSMENVRIYFSGDNLFTISDFWKGFDVEAPVGNGNYYPQVKTISFGIDVKF